MGVYRVEGLPILTLPFWGSQNKDCRILGSMMGSCQNNPPYVVHYSSMLGVFTIKGWAGLILGGRDYHGEVGF